jgi:hypothetical protein
MGVDAVGFNPGNLQSFNRYAYGNNNPYKFVDPTGNSPASVFIGAVARETGIGYVLGVGADSISQYAAWGTVDLGMAATSSAAIAGGEAGLLSGVVSGAFKAYAAGKATSLAARVDAVHGELHPIAANMRTTAGLETTTGERILAAGGRDLSPAQRAALVPGETAAKLPGAHAEVTALEHAAKAGKKPANLVTSRPICDSCAAHIESTGGQLTSPTSAVWK